MMLAMGETLGLSVYPHPEKDPDIWVWRVDLPGMIYCGGGEIRPAFMCLNTVYHGIFLWGAEDQNQASNV